MERKECQRDGVGTHDSTPAAHVAMGLFKKGANSLHLQFKLNVVEFSLTHN